MHGDAPATRMQTTQPAAPAESAPAPFPGGPDAPLSVPEKPSSRPAATPTVGAPWFLWPLVLFNTVFDACLTPWGAPGRWLRGPGGRWLLAVLGVLCLSAAGALTVADWFGWTW